MAHASRLLTIYNCGTASNRDKGVSLEGGRAGELIAALHDQTVDPPLTEFELSRDLPAYRYKLIHDGPGTAPAPFARWEKDSKGTQHFVKHGASGSQASVVGLGSSAPAKLAGQMFGSGMDQNVDNALRVVRGLKHKPDLINMVGWSRGGVTCHMIANQLFLDPKLNSIPVNIFAVDPVPGGALATKDRDKVDVGGNVRNYAAVFAMDDPKAGFSPAVVSTPESAKTRFTFYPMPGVHDTAVQGAPGLLAVAILVEFLAQEFLTANGTVFKKRLELSLQEICEYYAIVKRTEGQYKELAGVGGLNKILGLLGKIPGLAPTGRSGGKTPPLTQVRDIPGMPLGPAGSAASQPGQAVSKPGASDLPGQVQRLPSGENANLKLQNDLRTSYFVNAHHEDCFKEAYREIHDLLFKPRRQQDALAGSEAKGVHDVNVMKHRYMNSYRQLDKVLGGPRV